MSILDKVKHMLGGGAKTEELAKQGIDKAERIAKEKLGGKHARRIDTAAQKARKMADKINEPDTRPPGTTPAPGRDDSTSGPGRPGTTPEPGRATPTGRDDGTSDPGRPGTTPAPGRATPTGRDDDTSGPGQPGTTPPPYGP
ncbi:Rv0909 family putative TA system antitoxin [Streptosporangium sp. LJ11]|uniref:antitoxin n=1 Tax=Streptosporangium sp. LJ11 TaxID=3436927 RepID=UPI003F79B05F